MHAILPLLSSLTLIAAGATAQTWTGAMHQRASFYRTSSDSPMPPVVLDLAALGIAPGQWVRIESQGGFSYVAGGPDGSRALCAVFSGSATLLASNVQHRVVDAIAAGPGFPSPNTYFGNLPYDIPEDFYCSRQLYANGVDVQVPVGATHLFLCIHDSYYADNTDANGDLGAKVTVVPAPSLAGTGEHLTLQSAVDGTPMATPEVHAAPPGATMIGELASPVGWLDGVLYLVIGDVMPTGGVAPNPLPGLWSVNLILLQYGVVTDTPGWSATWSLPAVAGYAGTTVIVQGAALTPSARNGLFETTNAHRFDWQ